MPVNVAESETRNRPQRGVERKSRSSPRVKRVAFNVTETLDKNVELYALKQGLLKNQVIVEALRKFLEANSMQPDRDPIVSFSYR
jgi:hypothetical protein